MNRLRLNWLIDLVAGAAFAALVMTGFLLEWVLPPGTNKSLGLAGLSRHEWGGVHLWIALTFLAVLVVHVVMHWSWICATTCGRLGLRVPSRAIMRTAAIITGGTAVGIGTGALLAARSAIVRTDVAACVEVRASVVGEQPAPVTSPASPMKLPTFVRDIQPIFKARCAECHGGAEPDGDFDVERCSDYWRLYAKSPLVVASHADESMLVRIVRGDAPGIAKPKKHKLPDAELEVVRRWIDAGAVWVERPEAVKNAPMK
ncbi:MAG: DUF4405 domain-containing protein [Phycisphaerales bacterium]|nr:DUF4405 domain-containing protein [Phycisphaerales bacterium]